jgi:ribosome-binding protein aMBF1 (putative translation factor)
MRRPAAYRWLAEITGFPKETAHIRFFDEMVCAKVIERVVNDFPKKRLDATCPRGTMANMTPTPPIQPRFGRNLRTAREKKGIAQNKLARRAKTSASYLCRLEHGDKTPSVEMYERLALLLGLNPGDLLK